MKSRCYARMALRITGANLNRGWMTGFFEAIANRQLEAGGATDMKFYCSYHMYSSIELT